MFVGPLYVLVLVPNVAVPRPSLVNPPAPIRVPVMFSEPAAEVAAVLLTNAVTLLFILNEAVNVLFPVPEPVVVIVAALPLLSNVKAGAAAVPVVMELVKVLRSLLKRIDPMVCCPSSVMVRFAA